jgi:hypothetical protein
MDLPADAHSPTPIRRPMAKAPTKTCAEGDGRSVIELEAVACQHRIPTG